MRPFRPGFHGEPAYIFIRFGEEYKFNLLRKETTTNTSINVSS